MEILLNGMKNIFINSNICQKQLPLVEGSVIATVTQSAPSHNLMKQTNRNHAKVIARRTLLHLVDCDEEITL